MALDQRTRTTRDLTARLSCPPPNAPIPDPAHGRASIYHARDATIGEVCARLKVTARAVRSYEGLEPIQCGRGEQGRGSANTLTRFVTLADVEAFGGGSAEQPPRHRRGFAADRSGVFLTEYLVGSGDRQGSSDEGMQGRVLEHEVVFGVPSLVDQLLQHLGQIGLPPLAAVIAAPLRGRHGQE